MSLELYCRDRLVVLGTNATVYEAARAMQANHIGAIVVEDRSGIVGVLTDRDVALRVSGANLIADETLVYEVMTVGPATVSIDDSEEAALELMRDLRLRRLIITDRGRVAGIVTLDDLLLSGGASLGDVRNVVRAQLAAGAPGKPFGYVRPQRSYRRGSPERRREARRESTLHAFAHRLMERVGLSEPDDALEAFEVVAGDIVRRLMPREAHAFVSQLPALMRERLMRLPPGPDRRITPRLVIEHMARRLNLDFDRAEDLVYRTSQALTDMVSEGELADARGQLPAELKPLLQPAA
jgi:CBS domain-containing protein/uncharacterized protein (DUF2267 family)